MFYPRGYREPKCRWHRKCGLHSEFKELTTGGSISQLLPPVKGSGQKGVLSFFFVTEVIKHVLNTGSTVHDVVNREEDLNFPVQEDGLYRINHVRQHDLRLVDNKSREEP